MRDTNVGLPGMSLDAVAHDRRDRRELRELELAQLLADQPARTRWSRRSCIAYDAKTGRLVWESGLLLNAQGVRDHFFMGPGPYRMSSRGEVEQYPDESQVQTRKHFFASLLAHRSGNRYGPRRSHRASRVASRPDRPLAPGDRHGRRRAVAGRGGRPWDGP